MRYNVIFRIVGHKTIGVCARDEKQALKAAYKILNSMKEIRLKQNEVHDAENVSIEET